ncbi:MAG TPA: glycosyltransferase family 4 protein [Candidatus Saccharimonadia bacterium]|nr:glycosyltransferase family 4 protein [Candidatus Saccharimonadia bacterium]
MQTTKSALVISYGPVPTEQFQTIEGGGMRAWGLATGLQKNGSDVTVAIHESFRQTIPEYEGVKLTNWSNENLGLLVNRYDTVIMSYCMGEPSGIVTKEIGGRVQLILDAYVPIFVEISARQSEHLEQEYIAYMRELNRFDLALGRGDHFLCANDAQKTFYTGVLSALGRINPITYSKEIIEVLPFGIVSENSEAVKPAEVPGVEDKDFVILWFGGLYPWFDIRNLVKAVERMAAGGKRVKLLIVGGKNPFNPNPTFFKQYDETVAYAEANGLADKLVFFVDWVDYAKRAEWYARANVVISLNSAGQENQFSWRTRVMDFVWGNLPIATNGGDPLSETLIKAGAAYRLEGTDVARMAEQLSELYNKPEMLAKLKEQLKPLREGYFWESMTKGLAKRIEAGTRADDLVLDPSVKKQVDTGQLSARLAKLPGVRHALKAGQVKGYVQRYGVRSSVKQAYYTVRHAMDRSKERQYVFVSHPLNQTGGPLALIEMIAEFAKQVSPRRILLVAPHIDSQHLGKLRRMGIRIDGMDMRIGPRALVPRLNLKPNDFVLMNTSAIPGNYRDGILSLLASGGLKRAYWYVHEDDPEAQFDSSRVRKKIRHLLNEKKLVIGVPSVRMRKKYEDFFESPIEIIELHADVDAAYKQPRAKSDFEKLDFVISGVAAGGRKGHSVALFAFSKFLTEHYVGNESKYRDFSLKFIGLGDDYLSEQLKTIGTEVLGDKFGFLPTISRHEALKVMHDCNVVICCSLMEAFGLYVAEGMYMGHVVLRNDCSGLEEQLKPGVNGYEVDDSDIDQFAEVLERILNKTTTSNEKLQRMGLASQEMIKHYASNSYFERLQELEAR